MAWRLAKSLVILREQINALAPSRSKISDGTIGDTPHASRKSDHNPGSDGVVEAFDLTHDPADGVDCDKVVAAIVKSKDDRIKYIIWKGQIISGPDGPRPWVKRPYTGANKHNHHAHFSVRHDKRYYDDARLWMLPGFAPNPSAKPLPPIQILAKGVKGEEVERLQRLLNSQGYKLIVDQYFGQRTEDAVKKFQRTKKLLPDGVVGPITWEHLEKLK